MRLFKTILLSMLVASLVPTAMVGWLSLSDARKALTHDAHELAKERVSQLAVRAEAVLQEPVRALAGLRQLPDFFRLRLEEQNVQLGAVLREQQNLRVITLLSPKGNPIPQLQVLAPAIGPLDTKAHQGWTASLVPSSRVLVYSDVYFDGSGKPLITIAMPWPNPAKGYLAAEISLSRLADAFAQSRAGEASFSYVVDGHGRLVAGAARGASRLNMDLSSTPVVAEMLKGDASLARPRKPKVGTFDSWVSAYAVIPDLGWGVVWEEPIAVAYQQIGAMERRIAWGAGAASIVALALAALFSRKLTRPLKEFIHASLQIAQGEFGVRVNVKGKNELGELARNFNYMSSALQAYNQETKGLYESVEKGYLETIVALAAAIDSKDTYTRGHSQRVADLCVEIGRELGFTERQLRQVQYGGLLHDVGKIGIAESILRKGSQLTTEEMTIMRGHPTLGEAIIEPVGFLVPVRSACRNHHERWDGKGYPDGLGGERIPLIARIVNCADTFDACTSTRPYQKAVPLVKAMEIMAGLSGTQLDPKVVEALKRVVSKKGVRLEGHTNPVKLAS